MIGSLTFLPAVLSYLGEKGWVEKGRVPYVAKRRHKNKGESRMWNAILNRVLKRPAVSAILAGGLLVAMSLPALHMQFKDPGTEGMSRSGTPILKTLDRIDAAFPGGSVPATVVVKAKDVTTPEVQPRSGSSKTGDRHRSAVGALERRHQPGQDRGDGECRSTATAPTPPRIARSRLRSEVVPATVGKLAGAEAVVSGPTAMSKDFLDTMKSHLPIVFSCSCSAWRSSCCWSRSARSWCRSRRSS